jgi:periplasmic divalent cation tolerance protein
MSETLRIILTTFPSAEIARGIVTQLVTEQCIACGNLVPGVQSIYHWQGQLSEEQEVLALLKTSLTTLPIAMARLTALHPYEVPELVVLQPEQVSTAYAAWVTSHVRGG